VGYDVNSRSTDFGAPELVDLSCRCRLTMGGNAIKGVRHRAGRPTAPSSSVEASALNSGFQTPATLNHVQPASILLKTLSCRRICSTICCMLVWGPIFISIVDFSFLRYMQRPWSLFRTYSNERNPAWHQARYRAAEHLDNPLFNQWYYNMITDAKTGYTFSFGVWRFQGGWDIGRMDESERSRFRH
jgi:hypothetical protein